MAASYCLASSIRYSCFSYSFARSKTIGSYYYRTRRAPLDLVAPEKVVDRVGFKGSSSTSSIDFY
jgi:hypothetical protein